MCNNQLPNAAGCGGKFTACIALIYTRWGEMQWDLEAAERGSGEASGFICVSLCSQFTCVVACTTACGNPSSSFCSSSSLPPPLVSPVFVTLALPPLLFHPSWLCPSPPFFPPSILLSAGRRWVMPLAGRLKLSPSSSKYIFSIPLLPCLFYVPFSPSSLTLLSARRHHLFLDISRLCSVAPVGALPWFFCFSPSVWKSDSSAVYVSIILSFSPSLSPTVHPAVLTLPCLLAVMMWTHILFTLPIYCVYTLL